MMKIDKKIQKKILEEYILTKYYLEESNKRLKIPKPKISKKNKLKFVVSNGLDEAISNV